MNADRTVLGVTCEGRLAWDAPGTGAASLVIGGWNADKRGWAG